MSMTEGGEKQWRKTDLRYSSALCDDDYCLVAATILYCFFQFNNIVIAFINYCMKEIERTFAGVLRCFLSFSENHKHTK